MDTGCLRPIEVRNPLVVTLFIRGHQATGCRCRNQLADVEAEACGTGKRNPVILDCEVDGDYTGGICRGGGDVGIDKIFVVSHQ